MIHDSALKVNPTSNIDIDTELPQKRVGRCRKFPTNDWKDKRQRVRLFGCKGYQQYCCDCDFSAKLLTAALLWFIHSVKIWFFFGKRCTVCVRGYIVPAHSVQFTLLLVVSVVHFPRSVALSARTLRQRSALRRDRMDRRGSRQTGDIIVNPLRTTATEMPKATEPNRALSSCSENKMC